MNQDSQDSASLCALECARKIGLGPDSREAIEAIVSRFLKSHEEQVREEQRLAFEDILSASLERLERHHGPFLDHPPCPTCHVIKRLREALGKGSEK